MQLKLGNKKHSPIGVDLGTRFLKMIQLSQEPDVAMLAAGSVELPDSARGEPSARIDFLADAIPRLLERNHFRGRQCVLSIPAANSFLQHVKIPKMPAAEMVKALRMEMQGKAPFPIDDAVIRHVVAGDIHVDGEQRQEVIVVAAARPLIDSYLGMARRARLDVIGINIECCAIVECFSRLFRRTEDVARTILFIDVGAASTQVVLAHGGRIAFARNLARGGEQLDEAVAKGLGVPAERADAMRRNLQKHPAEGAAEDELYRLLDEPLDVMAGELTQCLRYYESVFRNQAIERAIFLGGLAYDKRLCQSLARRLNLPAQIGDPLVRVKRANAAGDDVGLTRQEPQPDWAVAVGLSLGAGQAA